MSTPGFVPQDPNSLSPIRYYTPFDPYYYSVDNRPLQDLAGNIATISSGGGDSARRATLISQLNLSSVFRELFSTGNTNGFASGLSVSYPAANTVQINPGAWYKTDVLNAEISTPVIKQGLLLDSKTLNIVQPVSPGQSIDYLIQMTYKDLTSANMASSEIPFLDPTNIFLPSLLLNGELVISLKAGSPAPTGTQITPTPDVGYTGLYTLTATYAQPTPFIKMAENGPTVKGLNRQVDLTSLTVGGAGATDLNGIPAFSFPQGQTRGVCFNVPLSEAWAGSTEFPNPYLPLRMRFMYSSDQAGGDFAMQIQYLAVMSGESLQTTFTSTAIETIPMNVSANSLINYRTATLEIPPAAFGGFLNGNYTVNRHKLFAILNRVGGNAADTAPGSLILHEVIVYQ